MLSKSGEKPALQDLLFHQNSRWWSVAHVVLCHTGTERNAGAGSCHLTPMEETWGQGLRGEGKEGRPFSTYL